MVCYILGGLLVVYGLIKLAGYFTRDLYELAFQFDFAMGIFSLIVGGILIFRANRMLELIPAFTGVVILIDAVFKIQTSLDAKRFGIQKWWIILGIAVAAAVTGVLLLAVPVESLTFIMQLIGIGLIVDGCLNLWVVQDTVKIHRRKS